MISRLLVALLILAISDVALSARKQRSNAGPPEDYMHHKFAPKFDIKREFTGFSVSFASKPRNKQERESLLRVPQWVAQEIRRWEPHEGLKDEREFWCLDTLKNRPTWFTDADLFRSGLAGNDASYRNSGFERGHMAMKLLVERLGQDAAWYTHTVLNAVPQRPKFNKGIWQSIEYLTGAWAQSYERIWVIQGPVFYDRKPIAWIGDEGERRIAVPDAVFKIVVREIDAERQSNDRESEKETLEVLAFLYPQLGPGYFGDSDDYRHERFLTSVDEIEELTGLDFLIPSREGSRETPSERRIERRRAEQLWSPNVVDSRSKELFLTGCRAN